MKRILCIGVSLVLLLTACSAPIQPPATGGNADQGIYELTFLVEPLTFWPFRDWDFVFTYNGEPIKSGHKIQLSLEVFAFFPVRVEVIERGVSGSKYSTLLRVPIYDGGSEKTEITVTSHGRFQVTFQIICRVTQVGKW